MSPRPSRARTVEGRESLVARVARAFGRSAGIAALALLLAGCAGYQIGSANGLAAHGKSIQIRPFLNKTVEGRLTDAVTAELRRSVQRDGTFKLATHDDGDLVVSGEITQYVRQELTFKPSDVLTVSDFRLALTAHVKVSDRTTGKLILDRPVTGYTLIRVTYDLPSSERQALPLLAEDLANHVTALLVEGSW
jgi:Lipopolysaccharide-assembly